MLVLWIVLGIVALLALAWAILYVRQKQLDRRSTPYVLKSVLTDEEYSFLTALYQNISHQFKIGTFKGGGVWREEASADQKEICSQIEQGRMSWYCLDLLIASLRNMAYSSGTSDEMCQALLQIKGKLEKLEAGN